MLMTVPFAGIIRIRFDGLARLAPLSLSAPKWIIVCVSLAEPCGKPGRHTLRASGPPHTSDLAKRKKASLVGVVPAPGRCGFRKQPSMTFAGSSKASLIQGMYSRTGVAWCQ